MESWQNVTCQNPMQTNEPGEAPVMGVTQGARFVAWVAIASPLSPNSYLGHEPAFARPG